MKLDFNQPILSPSSKEPMKLSAESEDALTLGMYIFMACENAAKQEGVTPDQRAQLARISFTAMSGSQEVDSEMRSKIKATLKTFPIAPVWLLAAAEDIIEGRTNE